MNVKLLTSLALGIALLGGCATTPATPSAPQTPDAAVDAFLRDYVGHQFGDDIAEINGYEDGQFKVPMKKPFRHFTNASCYYRKGKLYRINIWADIGNEYSFTSTAPLIRADLCDMAGLMGLPKMHFVQNHQGNLPVWQGLDSARETTDLTYIVRNGNGDWPNFRRYNVDIVDTKLDAETSKKDFKGPDYPAKTEDQRLNWGIPLPAAK